MAIAAALSFFLVGTAGGDGQGMLSLRLTLAPSLCAGCSMGAREPGKPTGMVTVNAMGSVSVFPSQSPQPLVVESRLGESPWRKEMGCVPLPPRRGPHPAPGTCDARLITQVYLAR